MFPTFPPGLAYSVIKNALFKVIKVSDASELGQNRLWYRAVPSTMMPFCGALKRLPDCEAIRPGYRRYHGSFRRCPDCKRTLRGRAARPVCFPMKKSALCNIETSMAKCRGCTNSCRLTINKFSGGRQFISGNRCERGIGGQKNANHVPNLFEYKLHRRLSRLSLLWMQTRRPEERLVFRES